MTICRAPRKEELRYDVFTDLHLNRYCTFACRYCYFQGKEKRDPANRGLPIEPLLQGIEASGKTWFIHITGGEPSLHPEFTDLCTALTENHFVSLNTNLVPDFVDAFCRQVPPERIGFVHASYHLEERERRGLTGDFVSKYRRLRTSGFRTFATQVAYPPLIDRLFEAHDRLLAKGVVLRPKLYKGLYRLRSYPGAYTSLQRQKLEDLFVRCREIEPMDGLHLDSEIEIGFIAGDLSFQGHPCRAGHSFAVIYPDGRVVRCLGSNEGLGNIRCGAPGFFEDPQPCRMEFCWSQRYGVIFAQGPPTVVPQKSRVQVFNKKIRRRIISYLRI